MQVVRKIIESSRLEAIIDMPDAFKRRKVEILVMPLIDDQADDQPEKKTKKKFRPEDFEGIMNVAPEILEKEIKGMRDEWERL